MTWFILDRVGLSLTEIENAGVGGWRPEPVRFAAASGLLLAGYSLSSVIWARIAVDLGARQIRPWPAVRLFMIANLGRYVPGKIWQIAGLAALANKKGVPPAIATSSAVLGQGIALLAATSVGLGALVTAPEGPYRVAGLVTMAVMAVVVGAMSVPAVFRTGADLWFRLARTEPPDTLAAAHGLRWLALYAGNWAVYALSFWLFVASFVPSAPVIPVASAFAAAYVLGYVFILAPAGIGIREGALVVFLTPHVGLGPAGGLAILARLWTTLVEVVPAAAFWLAHVAGTEEATE